MNKNLILILNNIVKIEKGKIQSENDEILSESELDKEVNKWFE